MKWLKIILYPCEVDDIQTCDTTDCKTQATYYIYNAIFITKTSQELKNKNRQTTKKNPNNKWNVPDSLGGRAKLITHENCVRAG